MLFVLQPWFSVAMSKVLSGRTSRCDREARTPLIVMRAFVSMHVLPRAIYIHTICIVFLAINICVAASGGGSLQHMRCISPFWRDFTTKRTQRRAPPLAPHRLAPLVLLTMVKGSTATVATFDGKPLCDYAAKCPQLGKRCGDASKDKKLGQIRALLQRIVDQCVKNPAIVLPLHAELMLLDVNSFDISGEGSWSGDYRTLERIPRDWKVSFLLALAKHHRLQVLSKTFMGKVEMDDPENIPRLFEMCVQAPQSLGCPPQFSDESVASITLTERSTELGDRLKRFTAASGFLANGGLDLSKGCFSLSFDDAGRCVEIAHATGEKVNPPAHVTITKSFVIKHNHLDYKATVELAP